MATDPTIPFGYLPVGPADAAKTGANFDEFLKYVRDRNDGTATWDVVNAVTLHATGNTDLDGTLNVDGASTLTSPVTISGSGATTELRLNNTATDGDPVMLWQLSGTSIFRAGVDDSASDVFEFGRGATFGTTTDISISQSTGAVAIRGSGTNDAAATGFVGEAIESIITTNTNFPSTGTYGDLTSIALTAGDWDIYCMLLGSLNGATVTSWDFGIGTASGNSSTGLVTGDTNMDLPIIAGQPVNGTIGARRVSLSGNATYYLKYRAAFSVATPKARGFLYARRRR